MESKKNLQQPDFDLGGIDSLEQGAMTRRYFKTTLESPRPGPHLQS